MSTRLRGAMSLITLHDVAAALRAAGLCAGVERIGGNVWAVLDSSGRTITLDEGQPWANAAAWAPVEWLACRGETEIGRGELTDGDLGPILTALGAS